MAGYISQVQVGGVTYTVGGTKVVPDGYDISLQASANLTTTYPGNTRGNGSVDLQQGRDSDTQIASGVYSTTIGYGNKASGDYSTALGSSNIAFGNYSTAVGEQNSAFSSWSTAFGHGNSVTGSSATAFGAYNTASIACCTATGYYCHNIFHSIATNYDIPASKGISSPDPFLVMHSGKLSCTLRRDNTYNNEAFELMDFTSIMFNGVLKLQGVYISNSNEVSTVEAIVHIVNNVIVGFSYNSHYSNGNYYSDSLYSPILPISGSLVYIENRKLYHAPLSNGIYGQVGIDYTCIAASSNGSYY